MNIFIARLDYSTTVDTLQRLFEQFGEVTSAKIIMDRDTGKSKGYGFVEMAEEAEGLQAIEALNGSEVDGREIMCKKNEPQDKNRSNDRSGGQRKRFNRFDRGGGGGGGGRNNFNRDSRGGGDRFNRGGGGGGGGRNDRYDRGRRNDRYDRDGRSNDRYNRNDRFNRDDRYNRDDRFNRDDRYNKDDRW